MSKGICEAGTTPCGQPARLYPCGWRCVDHTPARAAGRPEPPTPPGLPWWVRDGVVIPPPPMSASRLTDDRAIASGRRRNGATPERLADAKARVEEAKDRERQIRRGNPRAKQPTPQTPAPVGGHLW